MRSVVIVLACAMAWGMPPAVAQSATEVNETLDTLFGEHERPETFFTELQQAVTNDDADALAQMVAYPISVTIDGESVEIAGESEFVTDFDQIFTSDVKDAVTSQSYETLFANWQGVMIGDGEVWFSIVDDAPRITAINN
ncbi:hypothetical protein DVH29_06825 [Pelagibacterium lacus]|uniref:Nuclear transport factor 2 family protein n=2 Tax=Pelagibacterium lacus TaxID=2282655 RepID=A0A369W671_9HYPH|nr:hypothetical protein DVH29_06825 [Pelagibacterium lacus]